MSRAAASPSGSARARSEAWFRQRIPRFTVLNLLGWCHCQNTQFKGDHVMMTRGTGNGVGDDV